jgi:hypothetical protein
MSLKHFHHVFIAASWLLAFGFGVWCFVSPKAGPGAAVWGVLGFVIGAVLVGYHLWVWRKIRKIHQGR